MGTKQCRATASVQADIANPGHDGILLSLFVCERRCDNGRAVGCNITENEIFPLPSLSQTAYRFIPNCSHPSWPGSSFGDTPNTGMSSSITSLHHITRSSRENYNLPSAQSSNSALCLYGKDWSQTEAGGEDSHMGDTRTEATNTDDDLSPGSSDQSQNVTALELSMGQQQQQQQQLMQQLTQQQQRYIVETITMTTVTERRIVREADDQRLHKTGGAESEEGKLSGILKGGKLWKSSDSGNQTDLDDFPRKGEDVTQVTGEEDDRRGVRFSESGKPEGRESSVDGGERPRDGNEPNAAFKVGNTMISSSKPNSAVRQLFPGQRFMSPPPLLARSPESENGQDDKEQGKYLVTAENLKMFEEAKKSKLQQYYSSRGNSKDGSSQTISSPQQEQPPSDDDEGLSSSLIKRTIERNTLRRSLLKYPHDIRLKRNQNKLKSENSLVERIKQLTCDVDDEPEGKNKEGENATRASPPGEEAQKVQGNNQNRPDKIASSGMSSTYKKLTDLFSRRDKLEAAHPSVILQTPVSVERQYAYYQPVYHQQTTPPDLGNGLNTPTGVNQKHIVQRNSVTTEARKQFLSSLAPLTACVSGNLDDSPGSRDNLPLPGERTSVASTSTAQDSEYSLDDIEEVLNADENKSQPQPDVVAGTPAGNSDQDELALFVQQDAGRIERIRKRYSSTPNSAGSDDDEHDDYGFNRRPSVRGIKPRFGSTTEILQQMQSQLQPPPLACPSRVGSHITWPYYTPDDSRRINPNRTAMPILKEETHFTYMPDPNLEYGANSPVDPTRTYHHQMIYSSSGNLHQPMRIGGGGDMQYPPRVHHLHSESPPRVPPMGMMVPFQEHDFPYRTTAPIYARRAIPGSVVQMRVSPIPAGSAVRLPLHPPYVEPEPHYSTQPLPPGTTSIIRVGQQQTIRVPYPTGGPVQVHLLATRRSESPQRGSPSQQPGYPASQYVVARGTQTSSISSTYFNIGNTVPPRGTYYPSPPLPQSNGPNYNRGPLIYSEHSPKPPHLFNNNNYPTNPHRATSPIQSLTSSPTRMKPQNERGVPEGAASSSPAFPQDSVYQHQVSSGTNPPSPGSEPSLPPTTCDTATSPVTPPQNASSVYYSMNV
ncbi:hypothetical protein J6590_036048 [Homalodisca vitripennis]|nr:hypothetical protein J6590_036048 [Homalodisca vitripennis]